MLPRRRLLSLLASLPAWWVSKFVFGEQNQSDTGMPNIESATFGGLQYWADELVYHAYRIQRNVSTGHYRLLNPGEDRLAWGTFEQCRTKLEEVKREARLAPLPKRIVLTLHGIGRTRHSMADVASAVYGATKTPVYQLGYPSTREAIPDSARSLARVVRHLDGVEEIDIVAFSMGNLVTRHWLGDLLAANEANVAGPKLRRYVMIGPPNNGAVRANLWAGSQVGDLFRFVMGDAGQQLGPRFGEIKDRLVIPNCEFGIIAGGKGDGEGWHAGVPGDDDGTVAVEEAMLPGASDFAVVPLRHSAMLTAPQSLEMTCRFLQQGYFRSAGERSPLPR